jgi:DNA-binding response OmpR family regulator
MTPTFDTLPGTFCAAVTRPRLSGIEVLRRIRRSSSVPVLLLTARCDGVDRISGLDLGADDYVPKPCSPGELVARLRAILRRVSSRQSDAALEAITSGLLRLWPGMRKAEWRDEPLDLTGTEFSLLEELARNAGHVVSKDQLSLNALGRALTAYDRSIDVHISSIRAKLGLRPDGRPWILGVRGLGYPRDTSRVPRRFAFHPRRQPLPWDDAAPLSGDRHALHPGRPARAWARSSTA